MNIKNDLLNNQRKYWENKFAEKYDMFGKSPSIAAIKSISAFKENNCTNIIELGAGQGRDTLFFFGK